MTGFSRFDYVRDPQAIYRASFATIAAEADLRALPTDVHDVAIRMIHACGMTDLPADVAVTAGFGAAARRALRAGRPILVDAQMVAHGITRLRLPAGNEVICTLGEPGIREAASAAGTTRSAMAVDRWLDRMDGAVVAIGNAPTALFRLLELLESGAPAPAAVIGVPVGFVGAAESKLALSATALPLEWLVVHGRRGGSAMAAAAVNALASDAL
jgi:precorrin-8X/cobalt-precorrin-8 methylmutase